jgi:hypothetical protein
VNELANTMDPEPLLSSAEVLFLTFREIVETYDRKKAEEVERLKAHQVPSSEGMRNRRVTSRGSVEEKVGELEKEFEKMGVKFEKLPHFDESLRELLE